MRRLIAAIRVMIAQMRFVWTEVIENGKTVLRQVAAAAGGGGVPEVTCDDIEYQPEAPLVDPRWQALRELAAHMVGDSDEPEHYAKVSRTDAMWLALLSRSQLCRVAAASDDVLEGHMRQKRMMPGIVAADRESILARKMADEREAAAAGFAAPEMSAAEMLEMGERTDELIAASYGSRMMYA